jgi:hypothetical protein
MVTQVLIVGYELQVRKIGRKAAEISGQPYYPIYLLAPYRLACVTGGSLVAFIWTVFPYPITDRTHLRQDLGTTIYGLAKYYACVHARIAARYHRTEGDPDNPSSLGSFLGDNERDIFLHELSLLGGLAQQASFTAWEVKIGGRFPRERFVAVIIDVQSLLKNLALMAHITQNLPINPTSPWFKKLASIIIKINPTSEAVTSILVLLSASVRNGNALPPYLKAPKYFQVLEVIMEMDSGMLLVWSWIGSVVADYW